MLRVNLLLGHLLVFGVLFRRTDFFYLYLFPPSIISFRRTNWYFDLIINLENEFRSSKGNCISHHLTIKLISLNVRDVSRDGFTQEVKEFINFYHPDFLFLMETNFNNYKANRIIKRLSYHFPFPVQVSPIGFTGSLWVGRAPLTFNFRFWIKKIDSFTNIKDKDIKANYLITFVGYPHHHLQKYLWDQKKILKRILNHGLLRRFQ